MGTTICPKHGAQGILSRIEEDIARKIENDIDIPQDEVTIIEVDFYDETDRKLWFNQGFMVYKKTLADKELKAHYSIYSEDEELKWIKPIEDITARGNICIQCFREYVKKHQWNIVFPVPGKGKMSE